jgi:hypothetical protein
MAISKTRVILLRSQDDVKESYRIAKTLLRTNRAVVSASVVDRLKLDPIFAQKLARML